MSDVDLEKMERLISLMVDHDLSELQYKHGELEIELKRGLPQQFQTTAMPQGHYPAINAHPSMPAVESAAPAPEQAEEPMLSVQSPMVGTYYSSSDPDSPPYVTVGSRVTKDTTVCIIEAMKVFNEIKAEVEGTVHRIEVTNAQPVEYGQTLLVVRPD